MQVAETFASTEGWSASFLLENLGGSFGDLFIYRCVGRGGLIIFAINQLLRLTIKKKLHMGFGVIATFLGKFLAGGFTASGPTMARFVYSQHKNAASAKGTLKAVFMAANHWRLYNIIIFGRGF